MVSVEEIHKAQRAEGSAIVMAIGTATPPNCVDQSTYPDYYLRITNSDHMTELKEKFKRMCECKRHPFIDDFENNITSQIQCYSIKLPATNPLEGME
ncbi:hypothetical protein GYH30_024345 [Glycine max]|uniref:Chalcone/stilbene synthase N-terminal domain-containing protein n=1 Tax=Glycine max TaxID=3847 RepID=K7LCC7_SOYBN|nr:hypothetical protein GYH30_024345 [Glycine max]